MWHSFSFIIFFVIVVVLDLHCCMQVFSSCGEWGLLFFTVCGLLTVVTSLVVEHGLYGLQALVTVACELSECSS